MKRQLFLSSLRLRRCSNCGAPTANHDRPCSACIMGRSKVSRLPNCAFIGTLKALMKDEVQGPDLVTDDPS